MKTHDRIMVELCSTSGVGLTSQNLADRIGKSVAAIHPYLKKLLNSGYVTSSNDRPALHYVTALGREYMNSDGFGLEDDAPQASDGASDEASVGVFTSGEIHITANGKTVKLSKDQAKQVIDFICALPNRIFNNEPRPTMASLPSRVIKTD